MDELRENHWHTLTTDEVCRHFGVSASSGLSDEAIATSRERHGPNLIPEPQTRSPLLILATQFSDLLVLILLVAAVVSGIVGELADTITILVIVVLNASLGFIQEVRAEKAMKALRHLAAPSATVRRNSKVESIDATLLVPGDMLLLEAGATIAADARLIEVANLRTDESTLTGESEPVDKSTEVVEQPQAVVGDRVNMVFKGSQVTQGRAVAVVCDTGIKTQLGRIAELLEKDKQPKSPLQERLIVLGRQLALVIILICITLFFLGLLRGEPAILMFMTAVSLAVAAIPEALPAVINITLAIGANGMSRQNALIRQLPAVESLGSVTYICTDKTGTLTMNKMQIRHWYQGGKWLDQSEIAGMTEELKQAMLLCNDAEWNDKSYLGDPTETAILEFAESFAQKKSELQLKMERVAELPFDSIRKSMTTFHKSTGDIVAFSKGSPERILEICQLDEQGNPLTEDKRVQLLQSAIQMASKGQRILSFALRRWPQVPDRLDSEFIESQLQFLGFVSLYDPPRPEAKRAVEICQAAGIVPVMITGDHASTAMAIAQELGIAQTQDEVASGEELATLSASERSDLVLRKRVYARVSPEQKIQIVEALQQNNQFVAMTGDGVNDAPALRYAHVGVAMGKKGTDVAREASDVILIDDNFATIVYAVREGRRIYDNIRKFIRYTMTTNAGEVWTLLLAPLLGLPIPLLPIHILWINFLTDSLPGIALSFEKEEPNLMQRPPRPPQESVFANGMWQHILVVGLLIGFISLSLQAWAIENQIEHWQTMVFTVLTFCQLAQVMAIRSETISLFALGLFSNLKLFLAVTFTISLQLAIIYIPFFNEIFKTQPLSFNELLICFALPMVIFFVVEWEKLMKRKFNIYRTQ